MKIVRKIKTEIKKRFIGLFLENIEERYNHSINLLNQAELHHKRAIETEKRTMLEIERHAARTLELEARFRKIIGNSHIAADIHMGSNTIKPESWAVICVRGRKNDYVKFLDLTGSNYREVGSVLKNFERRNTNSDRPMGMKRDFLYQI